MYFQQLKNIAVSRALKRTDIARLAGVSRAAVTKWFRHGERDGWVNVETRTVFALARALHVEPASFFIPQERLASFESRFLWDHLYPNMERFLKAATGGDPRAMARLVEVSGFRDAEAICGKRSTRTFLHYKRFIPPARRKALETIWPLFRNEL